MRKMKSKAYPNNCTICKSPSRNCGKVWLCSNVYCTSRNKFNKEISGIEPSIINVSCPQIVTITRDYDYDKNDGYSTVVTTKYCDYKIISFYSSYSNCLIKCAKHGWLDYQFIIGMWYKIDKHDLIQYIGPGFGSWWHI